jgi:hypothetical protein
VYPITPEHAIYRCREKIRGLVFPATPAKKIKTRGSIDITELMHFGFVYSRGLKQYILFIDAYSNEDIDHDDHDNRYTVI